MMPVPQVFWLMLAGAFGTLARWGLGQALTRHAAFPVATLLVNTVGGFVLSLVVHLALHKTITPEWRTTIGMGFCGAFTTYSSFALETDALALRGQWGAAFANVALNLLLGASAVVLGRVVANAIATT